MTLDTSKKDLFVEALKIFLDRIGYMSTKLPITYSTDLIY